MDCGVVRRGRSGAATDTVAADADPLDDRRQGFTESGAHDEEPLPVGLGRVICSNGMTSPELGRV